MAVWLASDEAAFATGQLFTIDGGMTAASLTSFGLPALAADNAARILQKTDAIRNPQTSFALPFPEPLDTAHLARGRHVSDKLCESPQSGNCMAISK